RLPQEPAGRAAELRAALRRRMAAHPLLDEAEPGQGRRGPRPAAGVVVFRRPRAAAGALVLLRLREGREVVVDHHRVAGWVGPAPPPAGTGGTRPPPIHSPGGDKGAGGAGRPAGGSWWVAPNPFQGMFAGTTGGLWTPLTGKPPPLPIPATPVPPASPAGGLF